MNCRRLSFLFIIVTSIVSCTSRESPNIRNIDPDFIYFDYRITGYEDAGYVTVRLQYKISGPGGPAFEVLGKVELDGEVLTADSSKMNGAYYEMSKPVKEFTGHHIILFTDRNKKQYKEEFDFQPISLQQLFPAVIHRGELSFDLDGLAQVDYIKLMLTDTARFSAGIDRTDTVRNGHIVITQQDLAQVANGPVTLNLSRDIERSVNDGTMRGGKVYIYYELKREFELKD